MFFILPHVYFYFFPAANMAHWGNAEIVGKIFGVAPTRYLTHTYKPVFLTVLHLHASRRTMHYLGMDDIQLIHDLGM